MSMTMANDSLSLSSRRSIGLRPRAFTLVELLVVMGIIALLAGMIGLGLRPTGPATSLQAGQDLVASLLTATRARAVLTQGRACLLIDAEPLIAFAGEETDYLRFLQIVTADPAAPGNWLSVDAGVRLPAGVDVLPEPLPPDLAPAWNAAVRSSAFSGAQTFTVDGVARTCFSIAYTAQGTTSPGKLALTIGTVTGTPAGTPALQLTNAAAVVGLSLRAYGGLTMLNGAEDFQ